MAQHEQFETAAAFIDSGNVDGLRQILADHPELATARADDGAPLLIRMIDWPGHRPRAAESARTLLEAGAEVDARRDEENGTALAGALCTEELDVVRVLIEGGADVHATCGWRSETVLDFAERMCEDQTSSDDPKIRQLSELLTKAAGRPVPSRPTVGRSIPLLFVKNADDGIEFYRTKMGFCIDWVHESGCDSKYVGISRGATELHLTTCLCEDGRHTGKLDVRISTSDVDRIFEELQAAGVTIRSEPANQPWGFRECEVEDLDGNRFTFHQPPAESDDEDGAGD